KKSRMNAVQALNSRFTPVTGPLLPREPCRLPHTAASRGNATAAAIDSRARHLQRPSRMTATTRLTRALGAVILVLVAPGCAGVRPYRAMARAASSEENLVAQADDHRLQLRLHEALIATGFVTGIKSFVYMSHAYLVGFVDDEAARTRALSAAGQVAGIRSVDGYLPVRTGGSSGIERSADDLRLQGEVKAAIGIDRDERLTRVDIDVL